MLARKVRVRVRVRVRVGVRIRVRVRVRVGVRVRVRVRARVRVRVSNRALRVGAAVLARKGLSLRLNRLYCDWQVARRLRRSSVAYTRCSRMVWRRAD